jgi:hypothetical protein
LEESAATADADRSQGEHALADLAKFLASERKVRNQTSVPPLTEAQIRRWAETHRRRTGKWPVQKTGPVDGAAGETWKNLDQALRNGHRGLPGGSSLAKLLGKLS